MKTAPPSQLPSTNPSLGCYPGRSLPLSWILAITLLFVFLRLPHIGHPLAWDEAWILCAIKSIAAGGDTAFQNQLWRHPPMYLGLGLLLSPLSENFARNMEVLSLAIHTGALLVLILFVARFFGRRIALFTGLAYTMLPGSIFYSTWIKRDSLVILFCLCALWTFFHNRDLLAGLFLGLGFLSKESTVFIAFSIILMALVFRPRQLFWKTLTAILVPTFLVSGWWYLFYAEGMQSHLSFFQGVSDETPLFSNPWWYYLAKLRHDMGMPGLLIFAAGLIALLPRSAPDQNTNRNGRFLQKTRLLPLYILIPGFLVLSLSHGKPPWMTIVFFPFLALVTGIGWQFLLRAAVRLFRNFSNTQINIHPAFSGLLLAAVLSLPLIHFSYMGYLSEMSPGTANVIKRSYQIAAAVNQSAGANDKILVMPMIIQPHLKAQPDPILFWNLKPGLQTIRVDRLGVDFNTVKQIIVNEQINRLLVFPAAGSEQEKIVLRILKDIKPNGLSLPGKILVLDVEGYWKTSPEN